MMKIKSLKSLVALLLVAVMSVFAFACGDAPAETTPEATNPEATPSATPEVTPEETPSAAIPHETTKAPWGGPDDTCGPDESTPAPETTPAQLTEYNVSYDLDGGIDSGNYGTATLKLPFTIGDTIVSTKTPVDELGRDR